MKITLEQIQTQLAAEGWKVLSTSYENLNTEMEFECPEGHKVYNSWNKLRASLECPICKENKFKNQKKIVKLKTTNVKRTLALDQATHNTGFSIFDNKDLVYFGVFEAKGLSETERIHAVNEWLISMINNWEPDLIGIEGIQYQANTGVTTFQALARLQGVLLNTCFDKHVTALICPPASWRSHCNVKGRTRADQKRSMQLLIKSQYDVTVTDDCADAIGIGKFLAEKNK